MRIPLILLCFLCFAAQGAEAVLEKIAANFSGIETLRADFTQERELKALNATLTMRGSFALEHRKRMLWRVDSPLFSISIISAEELQQWDADSGKILRLSASYLPWLKLLFANLSGWMTADAELLAKEFAVSAEGTRLLLVPKTSGIGSYIRRIELEFDDGFTLVRQAKFVETAGDTVTVTFTDTVRNQPIPEEIWLLPPRPLPGS